MSKYTKVVVLSDDQDALTYVETHLTEVAHYRGSDWVSDQLGSPSFSGLALEFDHLDKAKFLAELARVPWKRPLQATILLRGEDDDCWRVFMSDGTAFTELPLPGSQMIDDTLIRRPVVEIDNHRLPAAVHISRVNDRWEMTFHYLPDGALGTDDLAPGDLPLDSAKERASQRLQAIGGPATTVNWKEPRSPDWVGGPVHHPDRA